MYRILIIAFACSYANFTCSQDQDTIFVNQKKGSVNTHKEADFYVLTNENTEPKTRKYYYMDHTLRSSTAFIEVEGKKLNHGPCSSYYPDGTIDTEGTYSQRKKTGTWKYYYPDGQLSAEVVYEADELLEGTYFDKTGQPIPYEDAFQEVSFVGEKEMVLTFIYRNIVYPSEAREKGIQGKVIITVLVDKDGTPINWKVKESVHKSIDQASLNVIKLIDQYNPAKAFNRPTRGIIDIPVMFKLENGRRRRKG